jgi:beta-glucosidase
VFPNDFWWGAATSAYQIEGSPLAEGAGPSNWHVFSHQPGKIFNDQNGDVACDHYHRYPEDVALMRDLGVRAYRFSISWSRIFPEGTGKVNQQGLDFYKRLVDSLANHDIRPMATLYHWDLPQALEDRGGWAHPESVRWFADYANTMYRALDGRVAQWVTINEPWVIVDQGYVNGNHAPGRRDWREAAAVAKNLLKAHGAAVEAYRAGGYRHPIGIAVNLVPVYPASESAADRDAANRNDIYLNRQFLDPVLLGEIPSELPAMFGPAWEEWSPEDLKAVSQPIDFVGINYYLRLIVKDEPSAGIPRAEIVNRPDCERTDTGWEIFPSGLTDILDWVRTRYGNPSVYITENGAAYDDPQLPDGSINDTRRVQYLRSHLEACRAAVQAGVDLRGYYVWSLLDNFEWQSGYSMRFGIVHVNFANQARTVKSSGRFYSRVIDTNGRVLAESST